jgi:hypothetical protein
MCFEFFLQRLSETYLILRRIVYLCSCQVTVFLSHFNETRILLTLLKTTQMLYFTLICPVEAELFHADRRS